MLELENKRDRKIRLSNPIVATIISIIGANLIILTISKFVDFIDIKFVLKLTTITTMLVTLPVAIIMNRYIKKIEKQKNELERLDSTNKKLFSHIAHDVRSPIFTNPAIIVSSSTLGSILIFLVIHSIFETNFFVGGLILSTIIPMLVSLPVAITINRYIKKIEKQKNELERLDSTNKKLFSLIAHDVRSPMGSLKGWVDLLIDGNLELEESKKYLKQISVKTDNLLELLKNLLIWSKRQIENKPPVFILFNTNEVINKTLILLETIYTSKEITLKTCNLNSSVYTDKDMYAFILRNILHNAIKFTPTNGIIEIYTDIKNNEVHTVINDSGVGISHEDIEKIRDKNTSFTKMGTASETGTGFGLSTCIYHLNKMNGRLLIESEVNKGTKMTIVLPQNNR